VLQEIFSLIHNGLSAPDAALLLSRVSVGVFFAISGFNKLFNAGRHISLTNNLISNNIPAVWFMCWFVPAWEFVAGMWLAIGFLTCFSATVLMIICVVAAVCESRKRVEAFHPINVGDRVADYLYLQEILYMMLLGVNLLAGSGKYSIDKIIFN
jgi:putative oxidoreductase